MPDLAPILIKFILDGKAEKDARQLATTLNDVSRQPAKLTKSFKESVAEQKVLIKSIEEDVKRLQKAYEAAAPGRAKQGAYYELQAAKRSLAEEQGTLLGLQREQIQGNEKESQSVGGLVGKLKGWAIGLVSVGAAMKVAKAIIASTETSTHEFERIVAGATSGVNYFFKSIASGDWANFFKGMSAAVKGATDFVDAMERINNMQNEQKIRSSEIDIKIAELRDATYDKSAGNDETRKKNLEQIIALEKLKYTQEASLARETYQVNLQKAATDSGLAKEQIENFIKQYSSLDKLIEKGEEYNKITKEIRSLYQAGVTADIIAPLEKQREALGKNSKQAGEFVKDIGKVTAETRAQLAGFAASANEAEAAFGSKNRRDKMQLAEVTNSINEAAEKRKDLNNQLKEQQDLLDKAVQNGAQEEIKAITARIVVLQQELALREQIAKQAMSVAWGGPISTVSIPKIPTMGQPVTGVLAGAPVTQTASRYIGNTAMLTDAAKKQQEKDAEDAEKKNEKSLKEQKELRKQIFDESIKFTEELISQLDLTEEQQEALNGMLGILSQIASGNFLGAALGILSKVIGTLLSMKSLPEEPAWKKNLDAWDALIKRQERLIDLSQDTGMTEKQLRIQLDNYQKRIDELEAYIAQQTAGGRGRESTSSGPALEEARAELDQVRQDYQETALELQSLIRGGLAAADIAGVIEKGLDESKTSVADFGAYLTETLKPAVEGIFKEKFLLPAINKEFLPLLDKALSDNALSQTDMDALTGWAKSTAESLKPAYDAYMTVFKQFEDGAQNADALSGAIKGVTEETASVVAGQMNAMRINQIEVSSLIRQQLIHLAEIAANTRYNQHLESIDRKLDALGSDSLRAQGVA